MDSYPFAELTTDELLRWFSAIVDDWDHGGCRADQKRDYFEVDDYLAHLDDDGRALLRELNHCRFELLQRGWTAEQVQLLARCGCEPTS